MTPLTDSLPATHNFKVRVPLAGGWSIEGIVPALTPDEACITARTEISERFSQWAQLLSASNLTVEILGPAL